MTCFVPVATFVFSLLTALSLFISGEAKLCTIQPNSKQPELTFSVISDVHLRSGINDNGNPYHDGQAERKFARTLKDLHNINPTQNALIINGDLTVTGMTTDYCSINQVLHQNPHPTRTFFTIGNHEFYSAFRDHTGRANARTLAMFPNGVTERECINRFLENTGLPNLYYDRWIQGYHFIMLGSEQSRITNRFNYDNPVLSDQQLKWLDIHLRYNYSAKPIFVFLHQPIPNTRTGYPLPYIRNTAKLRQILAKYPQVFVFVGHSHRTLREQTQMAAAKRDGFVMFNDASVRDPVGAYQKPVGDSEGLYIEVYRGKILVKGRDFTHQTWINQYTVPISQK